MPSRGQLRGGILVAKKGEPLTLPHDQTIVPTAAQAAGSDPRLARLLGRLPGGTELAWSWAQEYTRPGKTLDRLGLCLVMLQYFRGPQS